MVPIVNAEICLLSASALAPRSLVVPLIIAATFGQITGKVLMYFVARGALKLPLPWMERGIRAVEARLGNREALGGLVLFSSASAGIPPFLPSPWRGGSSACGWPTSSLSASLAG